MKPLTSAAAAAEATLKTPEAPTLTLEPTLTAEDAAAAQKARDEHAVKLDESQLTDAERKMVNDFSEKIDITDSNMVLQYGAAAQKNIASFSENTLNSVRTKDLGEVGLGFAQPAFRTGAAGRAQAACRAAVFFCPAGREPFLGP